MKRLHIDVRRCLAGVLTAALLPLFGGCDQVSALLNPPEVTTVRPQITVTPSPTLHNEPAVVYGGVETDQRVVSVVFEGYTDTATMRDLLALLSGRKTECVFFISGLTASEQPELVKNIHDAGIEIGNYGITAPKNMQDRSIPDNMHQFTRGQELIEQVCGTKPTLFRCNGSEYTREVLQAAAACGLEAGVQPTVYLNHRSFSEASDAESYLQRLVRGSVISIKLGQELDYDEYGEVAVHNNERPAIDPSPGISDVVDNAAFSIYQNIVPSVEWLLDALESNGYLIVSPEKLQQVAVNMLGDPMELDAATAELLDASRYALPLTASPLQFGLTRQGEAADLDGSVFVGDSVITGVEGYVAWRRESEPDYLAGAQFLTGSNLSVEGALMKISPTSAHPAYQGIKVTLEDGLRAMSAKRVYLALRCSDPRMYSGEHQLTNYKLLIYLIRKQNPGVEICVCSVLPSVENASTTLTNAQIFRFNLALCKLCVEHGILFLDVASALRDAQGGLDTAYCIDTDTYGTHLNDAGCVQWLDYLTRHIPVA